MTILVTGGAGYIGSHTCVELLTAGYKPVVIDNLCNSSKVSLQRIQEITGTKLDFHQLDIRDRTGLSDIIKQYDDIEAVIHFAGLKAVAESAEIPLKYYQNNVEATLTLCEVLAEQGIFNIVFSSSATVYGDPASVPIDESFPLSATNPYGRSKLMVEEILRDLGRSDQRWNIAILRYFNPVGAHHSGLIGEDPKGIPNNLLPYVSQVAIGKLEQLSVFGDDYDTVDGTGVRDYIHVVDLAKGHIKALQRLAADPGVVCYNLGTGKGYSVLEMIKAFEVASDRRVDYKIVDRRPGDIAACYADPSLALSELEWQTEKGLEEMMADSWRWQRDNPQGYS